MAELANITYAKDFRGLDVYKRAYAISLEIHKASLNFPSIEQYSLANQIRRASKSVCANLGEGFSKQAQSKAEFRRFILMSIGSCGEVIIWTDYCRDLDYISTEIWNKWNQEYKEILRMLHSLRIKVEA
jgi:four helix bundle protein